MSMNKKYSKMKGENGIKILNKNKNNKTNEKWISKKEKCTLQRQLSVLRYLDSKDNLPTKSGTSVSPISKQERHIRPNLKRCFPNSYSCRFRRQTYIQQTMRSPEIRLLRLLQQQNFHALPKMQNSAAVNRADVWIVS